MLNSLPKRSGIYFVKDNINNLQFKIQFRPIYTLLKLPKYTLPGYISKEGANPRESTEETTPEDEKVVVIKWQQKIFSSAECELYGDLKNCINDQQKKYHEILKNHEKHQTKKKRQRKRTENEKLMQSLKGQFIFTYVHEDKFQNHEQLEKQHFEEESFDEMFVYAALMPDVQLVVLRWFKRERLLHIYPDFTDFNNQPYLLEINSDYRHLYSYGIKDVSLKNLTSKEQEQFLYLPELPAHWRFEDELEKKFDMPPRNTQRCAIVLSINAVKDFEYDNLHVRYHIKLPANTILEEGLLDATTHSVSSFSTCNPIHIGLTWQITVLCEEQFNPAEYLSIFFEVISIDSWERERLEGFSHYSLTLLKPRHNTVELKCIRPVETIFESINRYFIGGRRKFDYVNFVSKQSVDSKGEASNFYCRYGDRMQNTGKLNISYQIVTQRSCELLNPCASRTNGMTLDDIMLAYKEARRRLEALTLH